MNEPIKIPLWLAVHYKKNGRCNLVWPSWLEPDSLERNIAQEKNPQSAEGFSAVPYHYAEICKLVLDHFHDEHGDSQKVSSLVQDLQNIRLDRMVVGLNEMANLARDQKYESLTNVFFQNIGAVELLPSKRYMLKSLDLFFKMKKDSGSGFGGRVGEAGGGGYDDDGQRGPVRRLRRFQA